MLFRSQVSYVKPSMDAAIAGDYKDLHFKNNYDTPIYIEGYCSGGMIYFNIYGKETRPSNREVVFESEVLSTTDPEVQFNLDASQPVGYWNVEQSAHIGCVAQLWKIVKVDGVEQSREIFNKSTYQSSPKIITVGTKGLSKEQLATLNAAVETKDEATVKSAVASLKDSSEEDQKDDEQDDNSDDKKDDQKDDTEKPSKPEKPDTKPEDNTDTDNGDNEGEGDSSDSGEEN